MMDKYNNYLTIVESIRSNFGDEFTEKDLEEVYSIYRKKLRQEENSESEDNKNSYFKKVDLNITISENIVFKSYEQNLSEIYDEHFADGNSLTDHVTTSVKTEWIINGKKIICYLTAYYEVLCAGHSGGIEDIEECDFDIEYSEKINYGKKTATCEEYIKEISEILSWKNNDNCFNNLIHAFIDQLKEDSE